MDSSIVNIGLTQFIVQDWEMDKLYLLRLLTEKPSDQSCLKPLECHPGDPHAKASGDFNRQRIYLT